MSQVAPKFSEGNRHFADALNEVVDYAKRHGLNPKGVPGYTETPDGWMPPFPVGAVAIQANWDIYDIDIDSGLFKIRNGTIMLDSSDISAKMTITNGGNSFSASNGHKAYLKITNLVTPACELVVGANWTDYPSAYEVTGTGNSAAFTAYHFPLYYFDAVKGYDGIAVAANVYAHRVVGHSNLALWFTVAQSGADKSLTVPVLVPSHAPLPSA